MDPFSSSLQIPDGSSPGPSRSQGSNRPVSVQPVSTSTASASVGRKRASHQVVSGQQEEEQQPQYRDVYSHPAALEYAAAHPKRTIPKFGPYILLQTLGEGEFGKVKLGLHMQWGEEVAVKLIRRGNIDSATRMSKVEREIDVLRNLKHPNIVRLYDVIETDKYIGIILEYASGGELFDHILAHRYLRERDACKLFSQLLSGVWYIHQKKIVHRDLKLENLLLDRNRNVIITDFGFANRFEHRSDDLMQTSCGSPCYAAPELVISDGLYVGSAVDIWSCGVILYAMLAGYLPFDDDPQNPDGDNINLLYRYIVSTQLTFPDYISADARDLLSIMLVPDPARRADLGTIMRHRWLTPYHGLFNKSVDDLERAAMEQHHQKRLAYQRQMRQSSGDAHASKVSRSHSARTDAYSSPSVPPSASSRHRHAQPEYLYETSGDQSVYQTGSRRGVNSAIVMPTAPPVALDDDPFAPTPSQEVPSIALPTGTHNAEVNGVHGVLEEQRAEVDGRTSEKRPVIEPVKMSPDPKRTKTGFRHTIQVEVPEPDVSTSHGSAQVKTVISKKIIEANGASLPSDRRPSGTVKPLPSTPQVATPSGHPQQEPATQIVQSSISTETAPPVSIEVTSPPHASNASTPLQEEKAIHSQTPSNGSTGSGSSKQSRHKKGISIDKIGITKIFGAGTEPQTNGKVSRVPSQRSTPGHTPSTETITAPNGTPKPDVTRRPSTMQVAPSLSASTASDNASSKAPMLSPPDSVSGKKSRRNTLTVMVEPFKNKLSRSSKGTPAHETSAKEKEPVQPAREKTPTPVTTHENLPELPAKEIVPPATPTFNDVRGEAGRSWAVPASTVKASKVMGWFRSKSKGKPISDETEKAAVPAETSSTHRLLAPNVVSASSSSSVNNSSQQQLATPATERPPIGGHSKFATEIHTPGFADIIRGKKTPAKGALRVHHGAVDTTTITTGSPPEVMKHVSKVLEGMGVEFQIETEYKYRCVRPKRRKVAGGVGLGLKDTGSGLAAFTMVGSAASNGVDKRGLPAPPQSAFGSTGGMLRGLLMRRQSSQVSATSVPAPQPIDNDVNPEAALAAAAPTGDGTSPAIEPIYGDTQGDQGDEVKFSVELTRLDRLDDTYSLDIRRMKGNLRSYKFLYDTLRERADLRR
ncbi:hypothetical protein ABKN59_008434 [Abortiporus biennis]